MPRDTFELIPNDEVSDFINAAHDQNNTNLPRPEIPLPRPAQEILASILPPIANVPLTAATPDEATQTRQAGTMVRIETTKEQLLTTRQLFEDSNDTLPLSEICARARLSKPTVCRLLKRLRDGEDITIKQKRGRNPQNSPALLKRPSNDLCFHNMSIRRELAEPSWKNQDSVVNETLPNVSASTFFGI